MAKLLLYGEFARACGVSTASVSVAATKRLKPARVPSPTRKDRHLIDADHLAARAYHARHSATATPLDEFDGVDDSLPSAPDVDSLYESWTLARLIATFGTNEAFTNWLTATKLIVEIHAKNLATLDKEKNSISRDLVRLHIFGALNDSNQRLLINATATIAKRVSALATAGGTMEDAERICRAEISRHLKASQRAAIDGLAVQAEQVGTGASAQPYRFNAD